MSASLISRVLNNVRNIVPSPRQEKVHLETTVEDCFIDKPFIDAGNKLILKLKKAEGEKAAEHYLHYRTLYLNLGSGEMDGIDSMLKEGRIARFNGDLTVTTTYGIFRDKIGVIGDLEGQIIINDRPYDVKYVSTPRTSAYPRLLQFSRH